MMSFCNEATKRGEALTRSQAERFLRAMAPMAPHLAEELWHRLGHEGSVHEAEWPEADPEWLVDDTFELVVQVNGKLRARVEAPRNADRDALESLALEAAASHIEGRTVRRAIVVPGRLVNLVVSESDAALRG